MSILGLFLRCLALWGWVFGLALFVGLLYWGERTTLSSLSKRLEDLLAPALKEQGLEIVRVLFTRGSKSVLQVMIDRLDAHPVTVDTCAAASREISVLLDVEDPIETSYSLEVTSPGIERPLVKPEHFKRFEGRLVQVQTFAPFEGKRKMKGILLSSDREGFTLEEAADQEAGQDAGQETERALTFSYEEVAKVCLVPEQEVL